MRHMSHNIFIDFDESEDTFWLLCDRRSSNDALSQKYIDESTNYDNMRVEVRSLPLSAS